MSDESDDDLAPRLQWGALPDDVRARREAQEAADVENSRIYKPLIDKHLRIHRIALDFLSDNLQWIADQSDLDLVGNSRPAAIWQMSGRCIGIGRLMLDALEMGYTAEVLHLARAAHEASRLLMLFRIPEEGDLLRQWLADEKWVRPKVVRQAEERFEKRLADAMGEMGLEALPSTKELTEHIYGEHSEAAHHRRRWVQDAVFPDLRMIITGVTPYWRRRAGTVASMVAVVEEIVTQVGDGISYFYGPQWYEEKVKPLQESFAVVRAAYPLP
jgi:hypothetical protein